MMTETATEPNGRTPTTVPPPAADDPDRTLSIDEASAKFNVAARVLRDALGADECKGHDFGGRIGWRVRPQDVRDWLDRLIENKGRIPKKRRRAKVKPAADRAPPKVGSVWKDRDPREGDRRVKVIEVKGDSVVIHNLAHKDPTTTGKVKASGWHRRYVKV